MKTDDLFESLTEEERELLPWTCWWFATLIAIEIPPLSDRMGQSLVTAVAVGGVCGFVRYWAERNESSNWRVPTVGTTLMSSLCMLSGLAVTVWLSLEQIGSPIQTASWPVGAGFFAAGLVCLPLGYVRVPPLLVALGGAGAAVATGLALGEGFIPSLMLSFGLPGGVLGWLLASVMEIARAASVPETTALTGEDEHR